MLKRNVVLGGLIAGAFLLPSVAGAAVQGVCSNCHTMHNSQAGVDVASGGPYDNLLAADCIGCHADTTVPNGADGRGTDTTAAPQVDNDSGALGGYVLNGGYFDTNAAGDDATHHNVLGLHAADGSLTAGAPGGGTLAASGGNPTLTCQHCHSGSGAHHTANPTTYRILAGGSNTTISNQTDFGAAPAASTGAQFPGTRGEVIYQGTAMNNFCATCHPNFHGTSNQESTTSGAWVRHPTDIQVVNTATAPSIVALLNNADGDQVVVGSTVATPTEGAATDGLLMCLSCHVPHGGPYADLLAFNYNTVSAGDNTDGEGCEICHSYSNGGM